MSPKYRMNEYEDFAILNTGSRKKGDDPQLFRKASIAVTTYGETKKAQYALREHKT
jgi:hypothetical protein